MTTAVVLAGIPGNVYWQIYRGLAQRFPVGYVFRGLPGRVDRGVGAIYDARQRDLLLSQAADAVWGSTRRSLTFCRNPHRTCALRSNGKTCAKADSDSCRLSMPRHLLIVSVSGSEDEVIRRLFRDSALHAVIDHVTFQRSWRQGLDACGRAIEALRAKADDVATKIGDPSAPILLPPANFGRMVVRGLISRINSCNQVGDECRQFRRAHFRKDLRAFENARGVLFSSAAGTERHGTVGADRDIQENLRSLYRLGCAYPANYHWDCTAEGPSGLNGDFRFHCVEKGSVKPGGRHTNVWPDDFITPI